MISPGKQMSLKVLLPWLLVGCLALALVGFLAVKMQVAYLLGLVPGALAAVILALAARGKRPLATEVYAALVKAGGEVPLLGVMTESGEVVWASRAAGQFLGRSPEELRGRRLAELRPCWAAGHLERLLAAASTGEATHEHAQPWLSATGELLWADAVAVPVPFATPAQAVLALYDDTERRRLEDSLARQTEELRQAGQELAEIRWRLQRTLAQAETVFEGTFDALIVVDPETQTPCQVNQAACDLTGYTREALTSRPFADLDPSEDLRYYRGLMGNAGHEQRTVQEMPLRRADGSLVHVTAISALTDYQGRDAVLVVLHDQEAQRACRVLEETNARLQAHAEDLAAANRRLKAAGRAQAEFLAAMSHEICTPLNAIVGFSELLEASAGESLAPPQRQYLADLRQASEHLLALVSDLLDLAQVDAGRMEVHREPLAVEPLVSGVLTVARALAEPRQVRLRAELEPGAEGVWGDERRVKQVLYNLLSNAIRYGPPGGEVVVEARREAEQVRISVRDQGPGIPAEYHERIFEEFVRLPTNEDSGGGVGLGLPLSQRLVQAMGGTLSLESEPGRGSVFSFTLPLYQPSEAKKGQAQFSEP